MKLIECYFDTSYLFVKLLLTGQMLLNEQGRMIMHLHIPPHLQAEYNLLHLQAGASLADVRTQYRQLAKRYHPDAVATTPSSWLCSGLMSVWWSTCKHVRQHENSLAYLVELQVGDTDVVFQIAGNKGKTVLDGGCGNVEIRIGDE